VVLENDSMTNELNLSALGVPEKDSERSRDCPIDAILDQLIGWAASTFGEEELVAAKEEFFWKTGKVFYDDTFYNTRMVYFQDYFLFQRPLGHGTNKFVGKIPFELFLETYEPPTNTENHSHDPLLFSKTHHSIFQVTKVRPDEVILADLLDRSNKLTVSVRAAQSFKAIRKKDLFQGFIYEVDGVRYLSEGLVFHPSEASSLVKKMLKKESSSTLSDRLRCLARLAHLQIRHLRHLHVHPKRIYDDPLR